MRIIVLLNACNRLIGKEHGMSIITLEKCESQEIMGEKRRILRGEERIFLNNTK
jgi:hypothetical protein